MALVYVQQAESERGVPCYAPDAPRPSPAGKPPYLRHGRGARLCGKRLSPSPNALDEGGEVRQWLEQVRPEDFSSCSDEHKRDMRRRTEGS